MTVKVPDEAYVPEIEQEVLGTLLLGGDFRKVMSFLREEHFIADVHRLVFRAICAAHEQYATTPMPIVARLLPPDTTTLFVKMSLPTNSSEGHCLRASRLARPPFLSASGKEHARK